MIIKGERDRVTTFSLLEACPPPIFNLIPCIVAEGGCGGSGHYIAGTVHLDDVITCTVGSKTRRRMELDDGSELVGRSRWRPRTQYLVASYPGRWHLIHTTHPQPHSIFALFIIHQKFINQHQVLTHEARCDKHVTMLLHTLFIFFFHISYHQAYHTTTYSHPVHLHG